MYYIQYNDIVPKEIIIIKQNISYTALFVYDINVFVYVVLRRIWLYHHLSCNRGTKSFSNETKDVKISFLKKWFEFHCSLYNFMT